MGGCGDGIATVNAENSESTEQYLYAEMELIYHDRSHGIEEY